ncbi:MAG: hypothetical protein EB060_09080 [Proteobacteria bacterium]|nr:hypothetical protein [Pseudomonadota bacterium]
MQTPSILSQVIKELYNEPVHDNCGFGTIATRDGTSNHTMVLKGTEMLEMLEHRGGRASDGKTGDGAGIQTDLPRKYFKKILGLSGVSPVEENITVGNFMLPKNEPQLSDSKALIERIIKDRLGKVGGANYAVWHELPFDVSAIEASAEASRPAMWEIIFDRPAGMDDKAYQDLLFDVHQAIEEENIANMNKDLAELERRAIAEEPTIEDARSRLKGEVSQYYRENEIYCSSLSDETYILKGLLNSEQVRKGYSKILEDNDFETAKVILHRRFSTGQMPSWKLAHPHGRKGLIHNGEFNTADRNIEHRGDIATATGGSSMGSLRGLGDSAKFDKVLAHRLRYDETGSLTRALMQMMIPVYLKDNTLSPKERAMLEYFAIEAAGWEGPGAIAVTDKRYLVIKQDPMGLRPNHIMEIEEGDLRYVIAGSEKTYKGDKENVKSYTVLDAGQIIVFDTLQDRIISHREILAELAAERDYEALLSERMQTLEKPKVAEADIQPAKFKLPTLAHQIATGWHVEALEKSVIPIAAHGHETPHSLGNDVPLAGINPNAKSADSDYLVQAFVQVTAPAVDTRTSRASMNTSAFLGATFKADGSEGKVIKLEDPILHYGQLEQLDKVVARDPNQKKVTLGIEFDLKSENLDQAFDRLCAEAEAAVRGGATILVLSDRNVDENHQSLPRTFAIKAVHKHLREQGLRLQTSIIADTAVSDPHQSAMAIRAGADAVNPYLMYESAIEMHRSADGKGFPKDAAHIKDVPLPKALENLHNGLVTGLLITMGRIGFASVRNYQGSTKVDVFGLDTNVDREPRLNWLMDGALSSVGGDGIALIEQDLREHHAAGLAAKPQTGLPDRAKFDERRKPKSDTHRLSKTPLVKNINKMQKAIDTESSRFRYEPDGLYIYDEGVINNWQVSEHFLTLVDEMDERDHENPANLRQFFDVSYAGAKAIPLDQVAPITELLPALSSAPMSHGALTKSFHTDIAEAFNKLRNPVTGVGPRSSSGEGGYEWKRVIEDRGRKLNQIIQIASGRFAADADHISMMSEIEIKLAQGAKPGEGGQLEGFKVTDIIASIRGGLPGIPLVSPPPQHDLYSIEDLQFLIQTLSEFGVPVSVKVAVTSAYPDADTRSDFSSTVTGVAKTLILAGAKSPTITIAGNEGGTGAAKPSSIKHSGMTLEEGLRDALHTLNAQGYRIPGSPEYVKIRASGGILTPDDVIKAIALGADEIDIGTGMMIANGCVVRRVCQVGDDRVDGDGHERKGCPVGLTGNEDKYEGNPDYIADYTLSLMSEVRQRMAKLGVKNFDELRGRTDILEVIGNKEVRMWKDILEAMKAPTLEAIRGNEALLGADFDAAFKAVAVKGDVSKFFGERKITNLDDMRAALLKIEERYLTKHENIRGRVDLDILTQKSEPVEPERAKDPVKPAGLEAKAAALKYVEGVLEGSIAPKTPSEVIPLDNRDIAFGTAISKLVTKKYYESLTESDLTESVSPHGDVREYLSKAEDKRFKEGHFPVQTYGDAGQYYGAFLGQGIALTHQGTVHSSCGAGMGPDSLLVVKAYAHLQDKAHLNNVADNTALYGATGGEAYFNGRLGARAGERASGVAFVCEGMGAFGLEYATDVEAVCIGEVGQNFGAGMQGGFAFLYNNPKKKGYDAAKNVDQESIRTEPLKGKDAFEDACHEIIKMRLEKHFELTGSKEAKRILDNFEKEKGNFVMAFPKTLSRFQDLDTIQSLRNTFELGDGRVLPSMVAFTMKQVAEEAGRFRSHFQTPGTVVDKDAGKNTYRIHLPRGKDEDPADYKTRIEDLQQLLLARQDRRITEYHGGRDHSHTPPVIALSGGPTSGYTIKVKAPFGEVKHMLSDLHLHPNAGKKADVAKDVQAVG